MAVPTQLKGGSSYESKILALLALYRSKQRGDTILYPDMERVTNIDRKVDKSVWPQVIKKAKDRLLKEDGIALRTERGAGVKLLTHDEQLADSTHRKRAAREVTKDVNQKALLHDVELTPQQQALKIALVHQGTSHLSDNRTQMAQKKSFLASPDAVNSYNALNSLRPKAIVHKAAPPAVNPPAEKPAEGDDPKK